MKSSRWISLLAAPMGLALVCTATIGGAGGCGLGGACSCSLPPRSATIDLGCVPIEPPVVKTTGPCSAMLENSQYITLISNSAGTCHVELTFGSGTVSSVDLDFMSHWVACGSDPHGCGEGLVATSADGSPYMPISVPAPTCNDTGLDAGLDADAPSEAAVGAQADGGAGG